MPLIPPITALLASSICATNCIHFVFDLDGTQKSNGKLDFASPCHDGAGDFSSMHKVPVEKSSIPENDKTEKMLNNGHPWNHNSEVADVIERLFSFSPHLISIG